MRRRLPTLAVRQASAWLLHARRRYWSVLVLGAIAISIYVLLGDDSAVRSPLYAAIAVLAATALAVSATLAPTRARLAWLLIAAGQVCWAVGDVVWTAIDMTGGNPYPSAADVLYTAGYPLLAVGLCMLLWSGSRKVDRGDLVDVAIVTLASLIVLWPIVFQPLLNEGWSLTTLAGLSYSTGDVLLLGLLAALFFHGERRSTVIWLTAVSIVLVFIADLIYYVPTFGATAQAQIWSDSTWLAAYILIAAAGIHPAERLNPKPAANAETSPLRRLRFVGIALLTMPTAFAVEHLAGTGSTDWRAAVAINGAVAGLVVLRLRILLMQVDGARLEAFTAQDRFETVFETAGLGISITENGMLKRTNPTFQKLVGYTSDQLATMSVADIVHPDDFDALVDPATMGEGSGHDTFERRFIRSDGEVVHAHINFTHSAATGLSIAVIEDITGRKELEEQMREAQKMEAVGRLAGGIAHDFNNIMTVVSGYTELLREQLPEEAHADVDTILDSVRRASDLTRQLLTFSRRQGPTLTVIDSAEIFRDTELLMRNVIGADVRLVTRIEDTSPQVVADPVQLSQVVLNLAVNARDAMPDGGNLTFTVDDVQVEASQDDFPGVPIGRYCHVTVQDTGCGMSEATRLRVFEPFFTTKEVGKGTGLGLSTTYGIVTQAGGYIFVDSEIGLGTRFQILLPAAEPPPSIPHPIIAGDHAQAA
jgi:PAS domain S-box-containing protein